jgi:hypothetical protein
VFGQSGHAITLTRGAPSIKNASGGMDRQAIDLCRLPSSQDHLAAVKASSSFGTERLNAMLAHPVDICEIH